MPSCNRLSPSGIASLLTSTNLLLTARAFSESGEDGTTERPVSSLVKV